MKVLAFNGSPRKTGNTATLIKAILEGAREAGAETELVHLNSLTFKGCQACGTCHKNIGHCACEDDLTPYLEMLYDVDAVVLGSPIYVFHVSSQTKAFIDRCYSLMDMTRETETDAEDYRSTLPPGKKFALVTSQGDPDPEAYRSVMDWMTMLFGFLSGASVESIVHYGTDEIEEMWPNTAEKDTALMSRAREIGRGLVS